MKVVDLTGGRMPAPGHLTDEQSEEWRAIVDSLPADYFRPGDAPLLAAFCVASALYKQATALIELHGMVIQDDRGKMQANPAASILTSQASSMAQMAMKLRLCPSARYTEKAVATKTKRAGNGRPWDN